MNALKINIKFFFIFTIIFFGVVFAVSSAEAATYYVDYSAGSDSNAGVSQSAPWKHSPDMSGATGTPAATTLQAGDIVYFKKGVIWPSSALPLTLKKSGSSGNPITFAAKSDWGTGSYAIFDAENIDNYAIDNNSYDVKEQYIVIDGLELKNPVDSYASYIKGDYITIKNSKTYSGGIYHNGVGGSVENNIVDFNNIAPSTEIPAISSMWSDGLAIRNNEIKNFNYGAIKTGGGSQNMIIEKNYIHSPGAPGTIQVGIIYRDTNNSAIRYNIIDLHSVSGGRGMSSWTGGAAYGGNKIYNNTIVMNGGWGIHMSTSIGNIYRNNIIYNAQTGFYMAGDNNDIDYNLVYGSSSLYNFAGTGNIWGANNFNYDPKFSSALFSNTNDFKLQSSSSAINTGINYDNYHNGVNTDYFGTLVSQGSAPDFGAIEYISGGVTDTTPPTPPTNLTVS